MATKRITKRKPVKKASPRKASKKLAGSKLTAAIKKLISPMTKRSKTKLSAKAIGRLQSWCEEKGYSFERVPT